MGWFSAICVPTCWPAAMAMSVKETRAAARNIVAVDHRLEKDMIPGGEWPTEGLDRVEDVFAGVPAKVYTTTSVLSRSAVEGLTH